MSIVSIFPSAYSQYFDCLVPETNVFLSESFLSGEQNQGIFSISFWMKIVSTGLQGKIFLIQQNSQGKLYFDDFGFLSLQYIPNGCLTLKWYHEGLSQFSEIALNIVIFIQVPSTNWVFFAISASHELNSSMFYYNDLGTQIYKLGKFPQGTSIEFGSILKIGGLLSLQMRIGDFKFYNNIYNDISDWNSIYSDSCTLINCSDLFPSICYGQCDQWCMTQVEWFLPLVQPVLYSSTPYYNAVACNDCINQNLYIVKNHDIFFGVNVPAYGWNDYSITGWAQFPLCYSEVTTFFQIMNANILTISLTSSSLSSQCDTLNAKIYNTDSLNFAYSSTSLTSSAYISNWFFFAVTINSASKLFTLYSQNGSNPPSALDPLISSSITYLYTSAPFKPSAIIYIGGDANLNLYPGNYADFRIYPGNYIDATLVQYSNNIYSAATYLDPHCTLWKTIWYCQKCENGYFVKNGICQKCHPSCVTCSSDDTEASCLSCASGYYAQPDHPNLCFDYCPLGYVWDSSLNKCTGMKGTIANINFDNNLSGDILYSNIYVRFGTETAYYPELEFLDPLPANKRGINLGMGIIKIVPEATIQAGRLFGSDFTIQIWVMAQSDGNLYSTQLFDTSAIYENSLYKEENSLKFSSRFKITNSKLRFTLSIRNHKKIEITAENFDISFKSPEWALYSLSLSYDAISKSTQIILARNADHHIGTFIGYYKEFAGVENFIAPLGVPAIGFMHSLFMYNYGKSSSEIKLNLGNCNGCSACPVFLNHCLPTCDKTEYVDENWKCQKCLSSCSGLCSRSGTCNLCYDDLCYKCSKYEIGACTECIQHANLKNGQCECESGYINQGSQCVNECEDCYYLDLKAQLCLACPSNCLKCKNGDFCNICKNGYEEIDGRCICSVGFFENPTGKCLKCDNSCLTCSVNSSNCTSCISSLPILYNSNKCYPCDSFEGYSNYFSVPTSYFFDDLFEKLSSNCIEICGDGRNMGQAQCDDGNINNGDGCSSSCLIEIGWSCFGGSTNSPDVCKDITPPSPILAYLNENSSGYLLTLTFTEDVIAHQKMSKNIKIEIDGITKFSWSISSKNSIYIIELEFYEDVDSGTSVTATFIEPSSIVDMHGNKMQENYAKTNLVNSFTYQLGQLMETSVTAIAASVTVGAAIGSMSSLLAFGSLGLQALWGMIEMMQMQYYLVFLSLKYPDNLLSYIRALSISNGNFFPNPFQKYLIKSDPFSDPPEQFADENYNTDFIMNAGQLLLVWLLILIGLPIILLLFKFFPKTAIIRWLKKSYLFSILLRLGIETFLPITLSIFLQIREITEPNQSIGYLSLALSSIAMTSLILSFVLILWQVTLKSNEELSAGSHKKKFGTLYELFKSNSKLTASFLLFQNIRKFLFVIFCVNLNDHKIIQVTFTTILSFLYTILLIVLRPFKAKILGNSLHIVSEAFYFLSNCFVLKFLDNKLSDSDRAKFGWIIIALLSFSLLLHLIALFIVQIISLIKGFKHLKDKFMKEFNNKFSKRKHNLKRKILDGKALSKIEEEDENKIEKINEDTNYTKCENHLLRITRLN